MTSLPDKEERRRRGGGFRCCPWIPQTRHLILLLCMLINIISYTTRMNINMTIVAMVKDIPKNESQTDTCLPGQREDSMSIFGGWKSFEALKNATLESTYTSLTTPAPEGLSGDHKTDGFDWSESLQGTIIGANYYGYILTTAVGGQLAELLGERGSFSTL